MPGYNLNLFIMVEDIEITEHRGESVPESSLLVPPELLEEMAKAGVLYGRKKTKTHPRMRKYVFATRNGVEILDIAQTWGLLESAAEFLEKTTREKGLILLVGTTPASKTLVKALADKTGLPYVTERWLGGTLTNFKTLSTRLAYFLKLRADREAGRLEKYTKKERLLIDREIDELLARFGGLVSMVDLPGALFIVDTRHEDTAVQEANQLRIPVIGLSSSDCDFSLVQYPIPANDTSVRSVTLVANDIADAYVEGKKVPPQAAQK